MPSNSTTPTSAFLRMTEITSIIDVSEEISSIRLRDGRDLTAEGSAGDIWRRYIELLEIPVPQDPFIEIYLVTKAPTATPK